MTFTPQVSLVIVSRDRPEGLKRLISALRFQSYRNFEVVVVSNYSDRDFLKPFVGAENINHLHFDQANISAARNQGIAASAGEIVAFCDDDAVPEPFWLERLVAPFSDTEVGSTGGFVRGRNGISYQWESIKCDRFGDDYPFALASEAEPQTFGYDGARFVKVQGTNCAFRKKPLIQIGGFDEAFQFFLDETDVSFELAKLGWKTTIVPLAEVQHGFEESANRTQARVPRSLEKLGISKAHFIRKNGAKNGSASLNKFRQEQRSRLLRLMVDGHLQPHDVDRLMGSLERGIGAAPAAARRNLSKIESTSKAFVNFGQQPPGSEMVALAGTTIMFSELSQAAKRLQKEGSIVTVFRFSYTGLFHKRFYDARGFWVQKGGLFGKSDSKNGAIRLQTLKKRVKMEMDTLNTQRPFKKLIILRVFQKFGLFSPEW